jgi:hypothetical protein
MRVATCANESGEIQRGAPREVLPFGQLKCETGGYRTPCECSPPLFPASLALSRSLPTFPVPPFEVCEPLRDCSLPFLPGSLPEPPRSLPP